MRNSPSGGSFARILKDKNFMKSVELYDFQLDALRASYKKNRVAFFFDMGLGKTFIGAEKLKELGSAVNLIVCQKSKIEDWKSHFNERRDYYGIKALELTEFEKEERKKKEKIAIVVNYDLVFRRPSLLSLNKSSFTLLLDESSLIQSLKAKRTKFILQKLKPENVILLSGTPCGGKFENLYSQLKLLGYNRTYDYFFERYVKYKLFKIPNAKSIKLPLSYKNVDELKKTMAECGCFFKKTSEVMDLPSQNFIEKKINPPKEYADFLRDSIYEIEREGKKIKLVGDTVLTRILRLRELCGIYSQEKREALKDLINSTGERIIIFYNFNKELELIEDLAREEGRPLSYVNGKIKDLRAYEEEEGSLTLVQYQAGSLGLNLQKANKVIYFSPPLSSELFEQSKKRVHRIGQSLPCFYYLLKCGIENKIYETLKRREDYTAELFKDDEEDLINF